MVDLFCSNFFWDGVVDGLSPQHHLLQRWVCPRHLVEDDTIRYAWDSVGHSMNEALVAWGSIFDDEPEPGAEPDDAGDPAGGESGTSAGAAGWVGADHPD